MNLAKWYQNTRGLKTKDRKNIWELIAMLVVLSKMNPIQKQAFFQGRMTITIPEYPGCRK